MSSNADQRPIVPMRAGLRRPDYGPMQPRVFTRVPATPHVTKRRTVAVDEGLLEAFYQTHIGNQPSTPAGNRSFIQEGDSSSRPNTPGTRRQSNGPEAGDPSHSEWMNGPNDPNYIPRTPRRESRTINVAPGSGRRTPRRRSRSNAGLTQRTTPLKALADANQARVNRLISEANRRGRVGRDKHSPMGILRVLSRIPGFNPPPKPSPDRQPLPGSEQWRKLTPKSTRTQRIEEFVAPIAGSPSQSPSKRTSSSGHDRIPSAKSATPSAEYMQAREEAFRHFVAENPFQDPEDFNKLWDEDLSVARFQMSARSRGSSFGLGSAGISGLMDDGDRSRDLSLQQLDDLMDPFAPEMGLDELRPRHLDDITLLDSQFEQEHREMSESQLEQEGLQTEPSQQTELMEEEEWEDIDGDELTPEQQQLLARAIEEDERHEREEAEDDIEALTREMEESQALELEEEEKERERRAQELEEEARERQELEDQEMDQLSPPLELQEEDMQLQEQEEVQDAELAHTLELEDEDARLAQTLELDDEDARLAQTLELQDEDASQAQTLELEDEDERPQTLGTDEDEFQRAPGSEEGVGGDTAAMAQQEELQRTPDYEEGENGAAPTQEDVEMDGVVAVDEGEQERRDEFDQNQDQEQDQTVPPNDEFEDGYMNLNEDHIERQEHEEQHGQSGVQYFDDFPSELGIMSNGNVLPTATVATKKAARVSAHGLPVPSLPTSLQKQLMHTFTRSRISREAMDAILEGTHDFFEQAANDLAAYAEHAGRKTIDESDVACLMQRLRIVNDKVSVESLMQRYLPRELRDLVLYPEDLKSIRRR
ncbi:hypothetical protein EMPS_09595 [Entomortierella parvispora]|uniref:CENP-T/Histone H4 histone fold domain-containing protein n=1 Tax=Entomortierella parvispora TaxID=205924 RepID=A0A9P3HIH7_9FUNG|nr:hypothetical protein EMPS_09595 [Entomortierella parvispora]